MSIADRPGAFISAKVTTAFPDGVRSMVLVWGLNEDQFREIEDVRRDIFAHARERQAVHRAADFLRARAAPVELMT